MAADDPLTGVGELLFSLIIGYLGALEFAFVARHLYHLCRHPGSNQDVDAAADAEELPRMRDRLDKELKEAAEREAAAGGNAMQDGVLYSNGFRVESPEAKKKALAEELERQRRIEEATRKQLAEAEHKLAEERLKAAQEREAEESARKLFEAEKQREAAQREREEREQKLIEAEKQREENERRMRDAEQQQRERQENERKLFEAEKEREENEKKLRDAELQRQASQRQREVAEAEAEEHRDLEANERKLHEAEERRHDAQRQREHEEAESEAERRIFQSDEEQAKRDAEIVERLLAAERARKLSATESELEEEAIILEQSRRLAASKGNMEKKQKSIEENARLFMEAEEEMVIVHQRMLQAQKEQEDAEYAGATPVVEEPCVRKIMPPRFEEPTIEQPVVKHRVKTQFGQTSVGGEARSKTLMFPGVSDEGSSIESNSSQQSSFSTQGTEGERQEPEGEDNVPDVQFTEDYLRSLDGIKSRPLMREDGSGRRRAFKKRRSSGSSNSSRESRASRDEELKMFTSLEEEELRHGDKDDYNPIKYSTEPTLRVKSNRRHKRSPAKDIKTPTDPSSLEMLGEESTNPWGEVVPETYKNTEFWKREKALSIDEEELELEKRASGEETVHLDKPKASSFEEATDAQNAEAAISLKQQRSKEEHVDKDSTVADSSSSDIKSNLQTSRGTEEQSRLGSPGLRRSPRIDEMDHYEERWRESEAASHPTNPPPSISVRQPDTAPWRDQYGLLMEGISDFYDFTASVNPSRSRSGSRNASPQPKNVANRMDVDEEHTLEVYDDGVDCLLPGELNCELVLQMLESTINGTEASSEQLPLQNVADDPKNSSNQVVPMIFEPLPETRPASPPLTIQDRDSSSPMEVETNGSNDPHTNNSETHSALPQPVFEINVMAEETIEIIEEPIPTREEMRLFVETLRAERVSRSQTPGHSRSRSRSPLPTADNIARGLEQRRQKRIKQNDEFFEKLNDEQSSGSGSPVKVPGDITLGTNSPLSVPDSSQGPSSVSRIVPDLMITPVLEEEEPMTVFAPKTNVSPYPLPTISIQGVEEPLEEEKEPEPTPESVAKLVEQLRLNRCRSHSRSRSRSPLPTAANLEQSLQKRREILIAQNDELFEQMQLRATTPEPEIRGTNVENVYERPGSSRDMRSLSPSRSRSHSPSPARSSSHSTDSEYADDFHLLLNLEGCDKRTLFKSSEELESVLAHSFKQREFDLEALHQLQNADEEIELKVEEDYPEDYPQEYERTFSEAARELRSELLVSGFKRSRYVGESIDLGVGPELEQQRRENAQFQRSHSPSPSLDLSEAREHAAAQREMQAAILNSLVSASSTEDEKRLGAKPKKSVSSEPLVIQEDQLDDMRHRTAEFQRSRSQSRSPVRDAADAEALQDIDAEAAKRELQDEMLDQFAASSVNFQNFSRYLNADFLDSERRASDSAIIQLDPHTDMEPEEYHHFRRFSLAQEQPVEEYPSDDCVYISQIEVRSLTGKRTWLKEDFYTHDLASLELNFDDLPKKSEYETEERSWARAVLAAEAEAAEFDETSAIYNYDIVGEYQRIDEVSSNDSEDDRQTVVEMDDDDDDNEYEFELDEGISDNNERTQPTDESHHDTSECEEAERNADRYANRGANDWEEIDNVEDYGDYHIDDGAVGGAFSDPDSYIEQIYNDAVKNRKQSGILRDFETMVQEQLPGNTSSYQSDSDKEKSSSDSERYALWAKTRELDRNEENNRHREIDISLGLIESERRDTGMRYLGDAQGAARQSTRLRTRYGYSPKLQAGVVEDDIEVDLNYKPKREYNWRKNFKLDESEPQENLERSSEPTKIEDQPEVPEQEPEQAPEPLEQEPELCVEMDPRRFSFGGESITLFSRSPDRELLSDVPEEAAQEPEIAEEPPSQAAIEEAFNEKPKKKRSKKKTRKNSKVEEDLRDDNDSDNQEYNQRSSATRDEAEASTETSKRKVRSRRSSKSSSANEDGGGLFSPRSSIAFLAESTLEGIAEFDAPDDASLRKKTKKRKKSIKDTKDVKEQSIAEAAEQAIDEALAEALAKIAPISISVSTNLTPASTQMNLLSSISAAHSLCLTPASSFEEAPLAFTPSTNDATVAVARPERSVVDTFDILKDANFYPLF